MQPPVPEPAVPELPSSFTLDDLALLLAVLLAALVAYLIARWFLVRLGARLVQRANPRLDETLERQHVWDYVALLAPALVMAVATPLLQLRFSWAHGLFEQVLDGYVIVVVALVLNRLLSALDELFSAERAPSAAGPIHTAVRWLRVVNLAVAVILALGAFTHVQVTWVLAGIGVVAAAGSIVFSDMLYNLVADATLKRRKLVAVGDWLEIPPLDINGQVKELGPQLIVVQNWDNSQSTLPPRYLINNTFRNWQQMYRVGTRRIQRTIAIDVTTVRPLDDDLLATARAQPEVARFFERRARELSSAQQARPGLTNVGLYRAYLMDYLQEHPKRAPDTIWRVSNEDAVGNGLPLLLLVYVREIDDVPYRLLDAEMYEHALAAASGFGLRIFQKPAGIDLRAGRDNVYDR